MCHTDPAPDTSRELLRHLGWLMEEVVRGSQEKVGLAQAAYDSVRDNLVSLFFALRSASLFDATNDRGVYTSFSFFLSFED